jgi:hypothetical protein
MLLDVRITDFDDLRLQVTQDEVNAYKARNTPELDDITDYLSGKDSLLDADAIAARLFAVEKADVFLSHAHRDHDAVVALAVTLEKLGLKVFVDACVWGDVYALLLKVDQARAAIPLQPGLFDYTRTTRNAANMYMILNVALQRMIDQSELLLFLDSKAVRIQDYVEGEAYIGSPWIFAELMFAQMVARRPRVTGIGTENLSEVFAKDDSRATAPMVRYRLPESSYTMPAATLNRLISNATFAATLSRRFNLPSSGHDFLDRVYQALPLRAAERELLGWSEDAK